MDTAPTRLNAFYDLEVSPVTFDFADFLALAELARRRHGADSLHVVIVPASSGGFRADDSIFDEDNKRWRLHNILLPCCALLSPAPAVTVCATRDEAAALERALAGAPVFPDAYAVARPRADFLLSGIVAAAVQGNAIPDFRATVQAVDYVRRWLAGHARGRRPVTVTLREATHEAARNSDLQAWSGFARRLDQATYLPIFVRDTERAFEPSPAEIKDFLLCPFAPVNLDLRIALYEESWLNLMVPNGPGVVCWLDPRVRLLMFKMLTESSNNANAVYVTSQGLKVGGQAPFATPFQRMVWEPDTREVIEREFAAMAARIGDAPVGTDAEPDPTNTEPPIDVAVRLQATGRLEEATAIYQDIVTKDPNNADAWHLLGIIAHQAERPDAAEKTILRAISLRPEQANYYINLGAVLRKAERRDEATNCLWRAVALAPNDAGAHADLAELLQAAGANDKAKAALLKAIRLKPDSPELCERAARVLHALGHAAEAAELYRRALDLREAQLSQARKARAHMSEIPIATLKTT
jgi:tetratricopeptide (TPR) repeat protein